MITAERLINKIGRLTSELMQTYGELSQIETARLESFNSAFMHSTGDSIAARTRDAEGAVVDLESELANLKGKRNSLLAEIDFYKLYLTHYSVIMNGNIGSADQCGDDTGGVGKG